MTLHFLKCGNELIKIFCIEHDSGLLAATRLLGDFEKLAIGRLLQVDIKRALLGMNGDGMQIVCKATATAALRSAFGRHGRAVIAVLAASRQIGHGIEHRKERKR